MGNRNATQSTNGATLYGSYLGGRTNATESQTQHKLYVAYTISDIRAFLIEETGGTAVQYSFRDDGVTSSNLTVTLSVDSTWYEDTTGSDTPAADSLCNAIFVHTGGGHGDTFTVGTIMATYEHASTMAPLFAGLMQDFAVQYTALATAGVQQDAATETSARTKIYRALTLSNFFVNVYTFSSGSVDFAVRKSGANSTNLALTASAAGQVEDTTGSESYVSGDTSGFTMSAGSGTNGGLVHVQGDTAEAIWGAADFTNITTRAYSDCFGEFVSTTANDNFLARIGTVSAGNLRTYVETAGSGTRDVTLRINTTNSTNLTISVTATGEAEDVTGSDSVADGDSVVLTAASTGTAIHTGITHVELPWSGAAPAGQPFRKRHGGVPGMRLGGTTFGGSFHG